jgi:iron complex outermembrane receptor protein
MKITLSLILYTALALQAEEIVLDEVSVTATKVATPTKEVSQSVSVVSKEEIENLPMQNITETFTKVPGVSAVSKNGAFDTTIFIRGAGVKSRYGVREIMVLRDGVPMTDPDSFTRFDFIDTQDIEQVEITKGPGSIYASGSAGGTIQILSKSVFDEQQNRIRVGLGSFNSKNLHIRVGGQIDENDFFSVTATHKESDQSWRYWNEFSSDQVSFKYGHIFSDDSTLETELSYTKADLQLPTSLTEAEFDKYMLTGKVTDKTEEEWQHRGRYSEILFFNTRYEKEFDGFTFKPQAYYNTWNHYHPVPYTINNDSGKNHVLGTDIAFEVPHEINGNKSTFLAGLTARANLTRDDEKYTYRDYTEITVTPGFGAPYQSIEYTLSDEKGDLAATGESDTYLYGFYLQEMMQLTEKLSVDMMARVEKAEFDIDGNEMIKADYAKTHYTTTDVAGVYNIDRDFTLASYRLGTSYALIPTTSVYASIGYSDQVPNESELKTNLLYAGSEPLPQLEASKATNYEIGLKHRDEKVFIDMAAYYTTIDDDMVQVVDSVTQETGYQNAGKVEKKGFEIQAEYNFVPSTKIGASYAYSRYKYKELTEYVRTGATLNPVDRSGNYLPYVPKNQYALYASYGKAQGVQASIESQTWGSYYTDNSNTAKYEGFKFVTNANLGYIAGPHRVNLFVNNLFDKQYAVNVKGDDSELTYTPAAPRTVMLNYTYQF